VCCKRFKKFYFGPQIELLLHILMISLCILLRTNKAVDPISEKIQVLEFLLV